MQYDIRIGDETHQGKDTGRADLLKVRVEYVPPVDTTASSADVMIVLQRNYTSSSVDSHASIRCE